MKNFNQAKVDVMFKAILFKEDTVLKLIAPNMLYGNVNCNQSVLDTAFFIALCSVKLLDTFG